MSYEGDNFTINNSQTICSSSWCFTFVTFLNGTCLFCKAVAEVPGVSPGQNWNLGHKTPRNVKSVGVERVAVKSGKPQGHLRGQVPFKQQTWCGKSNPRKAYAVHPLNFQQFSYITLITTVGLTAYERPHACTHTFRTCLQHLLCCLQLTQAGYGREEACLSSGESYQITTVILQSTLKLSIPTVEVVVMETIPGN